jgi:Xaa-Pro aminopeptidase
MQQENISCLLVSSVLNHAVRYLGFFDCELQGRGSGAPQLVSVLLSVEHNPILFLQTFTAANYMRPRAQAGSYIEDVRLVGGDNQNVLRLVSDQLRSWRFEHERLGLAGGEIEWAERLFFAQECPNLRLTDANNFLDHMRIVKEPEEIELIRQSAAVGDVAMLEVEKHMAVGLTDFEVYSRGDAAMRRAGAEEDTFVLMGIGPNPSAMLMEGLNGRKLRKGNVVVYETLPFYRLYNSELAVTFSLGSPSGMQKRAATACETAYKAGLAEIKPGVMSANVVEASLREFHVSGFESFTHTPGHFIGLDNYEGPGLRSPDLVLEPGMVFSFHPNVVIPGQVKEEVSGLILVTEKGAENLSKYPIRGIREL